MNRLQFFFFVLRLEIQCYYQRIRNKLFYYFLKRLTPPHVKSRLLNLISKNLTNYKDYTPTELVVFRRLHNTLNTKAPK